MQICAATLAQSPATAPSTGLNSLGIAVGPDTTFLTSPLLPNGGVDYAGALNDRESQGVTPANNAECVLIRITQEDQQTPDEIQRRAAIRRLIGAPDNSATEIIWQNWPGFKQAIPTDDPANPAYVNRFERATNQPWSSQETPELAAWLKSNETALQLVALAATRTRYWTPIVLPPGKSELIEEQYHGPTNLHNCADALRIRAMLKLHDGEEEGALDDLLTVQRLGALLGQSDRLIYCLAANNMREAACMDSWRVLQDSHLPAARLSEWSAELLALPSIPRLEDQTGLRLRCEFLSMVQTMAAAETEEMLKHMTPGQLLAARLTVEVLKIPILDWNRILQYGNRYYDAILKDRSSLPPQQRDSELKALADWTAQMEKISANADRNGNPPNLPLPATGETRDAYSDRVGAIIVLITVPSLHRAGELTRQSNEQLDWTARAGVALAKYRQDHGEYPANLDALIPKYLPHLPNNVLGTPIVYERRGNGYLIRHVRQYSDWEKAQLAKSGEDFEPSDVIIRTDK